MQALASEEFRTRQRECLKTLLSARCPANAVNNAGGSALDVLNAVAHEASETSDLAQLLAAASAAPNKGVGGKGSESHWTAPCSPLDLSAQHDNALQEVQKEMAIRAVEAEWLDGDFPPGPGSLYMDVQDPPQPGLMGNPDAWEDLKAVYQGLSLDIVAGASSTLGADCIVQGEVGDCYFISDLSMMLGRRLHSPESFVLRHGEHVNAARFYITGRWRWIIVDSLIPCRHSTIHEGRFFPIYAEAKDAGEKWNSQNGSNVSVWAPLVEKAYAKMHGSYEAIDGGYGRYATVDIQGGHSKSITHPEHSLACPETSAMPVVVKLAVYMGNGNIRDAAEPAVACVTTSMESILAQPCFEQCDHAANLPSVFLTLLDGNIVGGAFPSFTPNLPLHTSWSNSQYSRISQGSYTVDEATGGGTVEMILRSHTICDTA